LGQVGTQVKYHARLDTTRAADLALRQQLAQSQITVLTA
jgi:hypothetical protein